MTITNDSIPADLKGSYRRFGEFGPVFVVHEVRVRDDGEQEADIEMLESQETLTLPVTEVLACIEAE